LPRRNQHCAAALIEIGLGERKRRVDPQPRRARGRRSARAAPAAVRTVARGAHDGDHLLHLRRISGIAQTLVARRASGVESRHGRRRSASTGAIEQVLGLDP
jgi:hypothetical protein